MSQATAAVDMDKTFGALFVGVLLATFLQGLLTLQAYTYFVNFPTDRVWLKIMVASVWFLDAVNLGLIAQSTYYYLVTNWGNAEALAFGTVPFNLHMLFIGLPSLICQFFFLYRIWTFSEHNYVLVGALAILCVASFAVLVVGVAQILLDLHIEQYSHQTKKGIWIFTSAASADLLIAFALVWYLRKSKGPEVDFKGAYWRTDLILARITQYTVATGLLTSIFGFVVLAAFMLSPTTFIFIGIYFSFGRIYTNALLVNLNARRSLRESINQPTENIRIPHLAAGSAPPATSWVVDIPLPSRGEISMASRSCGHCGKTLQERPRMRAVSEGHTASRGDYFNGDLCLGETTTAAEP
ncbi:ANK-REP-REGION domain-containing protein [Mycena kentingensis (nom. inval.)]|nr:ANK-REP-REGION domain-containing protein [Mycena kentingensis (nom. inval.)]